MIRLPVKMSAGAVTLANIGEAIAGCIDKLGDAAENYQGTLSIPAHTLIFASEWISRINSCKSNVYIEIKVLNHRAKWMLELSDGKRTAVAFNEGA